jgi:hypothetical protein
MWQNADAAADMHKSGRWTIEASKLRLAHYHMIMMANGCVKEPGQPQAAHSSCFDSFKLTNTT